MVILPRPSAHSLKLRRRHARASYYVVDSSVCSGVGVLQRMLASRACGYYCSMFEGQWVGGRVGVSSDGWTRTMLLWSSGRPSTCSSTSWLAESMLCRSRHLVLPAISQRFIPSCPQSQLQVSESIVSSFRSLLFARRSERLTAASAAFRGCMICHQICNSCLESTE